MVTGAYYIVAGLRDFDPSHRPPPKNTWRSCCCLGIVQDLLALAKLPSANVWTAGWACYFGWLMKELWDTRTLEVGWTPLPHMNAWKMKEKYPRSKGVINKYKELDAVDSNTPFQVSPSSL